MTTKEKVDSLLAFLDEMEKKIFYLISENYTNIRDIKNKVKEIFSEEVS